MKTPTKLTRREREERHMERLTAQIEAFAEKEQGSERYNAADLRRRLGVTWDRLRPFGIRRPDEKGWRETRYPLRQTREALAAPPLPPVEPETVTAYVVRHPDGSIRSRHFDEHDALIRADSANNIRPPSSGLYVVEAVTATLRPVTAVGGAP